MLYQCPCISENLEAFLVDPRQKTSTMMRHHPMCQHSLQRISANRSTVLVWIPTTRLSIHAIMDIVLPKGLLVFGVLLRRNLLSLSRLMLASLVLPFLLCWNDYHYNDSSPSYHHGSCCCLPYYYRPYHLCTSTVANWQFVLCGSRLLPPEAALRHPVTWLKLP